MYQMTTVEKSLPLSKIKKWHICSAHQLSGPGHYMEKPTWYMESGMSEIQVAMCSRPIWDMDYGKSSIWN